MRTDEMTEEMRLEAIDWQNRHLREVYGEHSGLPFDIFPKNGMVAIADDGRLIAAGMMYLEKTVPVAVCGFLFANPDASAQEKHTAVKLVLASLPVYARKLGAKCVISTYGRRSLNRMLDRMGVPTIEHAETKILSLEV